MAEEINVNNIFLEKANIKAEFKDNCIDIFETSLSANDTELKDNVWDDRLKEYSTVQYSTVDDMKIELSSTEACNIVEHDVKIENEIDTDDIKIEFENNLFFCDHCNEHYEDYCTRCGMLVHILNGNIPSLTDDRAIKGLPNDILEIRESFGHVGVFALKVIPEGVKMGPFNGLSTSECPRRLKGGKFIVTEDKSDLLNWMQYINPARNMFQQNLVPFQRKDKLYYHCNREILVGEELLVYFGEEYEDSVNKDIEMDFIAPAEDDVNDVFACTSCCLGFSSRGYLAKHKSTCLNETNRRFSIGELTQCPICNIYFHEGEYLECHRPYCCETNIRKCISLALDNQTGEVNKHKTQRLQIYKCTQCKFKTSYKSVFEFHLNKHYKGKMYRCEICSRQFKTKRYLELHGKYRHNIHVEGNAGQKCTWRDYMKANTKSVSNSKVYSYSQAETQHLKEFSYECEECDYETNYKKNLERHVTSKHLEQFSYECEKCDYKTNHMEHFKVHVKSKHLKQFSHECEKCDYKTNRKLDLERHVKSKHLEQFSYECEICDYKTNLKQRLEVHVKSKHLKKFSYECEKCDYKTNEKSHFEEHVKSKHLKQFRYGCEKCDYKTNQKSQLEIHVKSKHLKQFSYECELCVYRTNGKVNFGRHIKSKHLKQFSYVCEKCDYKTNRKPDLTRHVKSKHLNQFSYKCEKCDYKTNRKQRIEVHVKSKHLKQFSYACEICDYKTNNKSHLSGHIKRHLK